MPRDRWRRSAALAVLLPAAVSPAGPYCEQPDAVAEWRAMAERYAGSDDWQRLHALWLGLCQKLREGSIEYERAVDLFERERQDTLRRMRQRRISPLRPFG